MNILPPALEPLHPPLIYGLCYANETFCFTSHALHPGDVYELTVGIFHPTELTHDVLDFVWTLDPWTNELRLRVRANLESHESFRVLSSVVRYVKEVNQHYTKILNRSVAPLEIMALLVKIGFADLTQREHIWL